MLFNIFLKIKIFFFISIKFNSEEVCQESFKQKAAKLGPIVKKMPYGVWMTVYEFIPDIHSLTNMSLISKLFYDISKINLMWYHCLKSNFPITFNRHYADSKFPDYN